MNRTDPSPSLDATRVDPIESLRAAARRHELQPGDRVVFGGQPRTTVFLAVAGLFAVQLASADGGTHIDGFRLRGALLGVDDLGGPCYGADVVALEPGCVFEIDAAMVLRNPELLGWLKAAIAKEQGGAAAWASAMARRDPRERVAAFLLDIASRHAAAHQNPWSLPIEVYWPHLEDALALSGDDIARALTALAELGLIDGDADEVVILDLDGLRLAADPLAVVDDVADVRH
jgi:CRP/FNR family transcriptional regulator